MNYSRLVSIARPILAKYAYNSRTDLEICFLLLVSFHKISDEADAHARKLRYGEL